jgi:phosphopantothenoylcysteine decarboxylase / phosphopantothenate---cysteine ligase
MNTKINVLLGVTGSIAAYKAVELVRAVIKQGWNVQVIMTDKATRFVGEISFRTLSRNPVITDLFEEPEKWEPGHVALADKSDMLVIAPCTANVLAKLANGLADDALTAIALACLKPLIIAPAMNENMYKHPATQNNINILQSRGAAVIQPGKGELASGDQGWGRMPEINSILEVMRNKMT